MRYAAVITEEGKNRLVDFPGCPGCQTFAEPGDDVERVATEALEGWLESYLASRQVPPLPSTRVPKGAVLWVSVRPVLAIKVQIRHARHEKGWSQEQLADAVGWKSQAMVAKLEDPDHNITFETAAKVADALGLEFDPAFRERK